MAFQFLYIAHVVAIDPDAGIAIHTRVAMERNLTQNFAVLCRQIRDHAEKFNGCEQSHCREEPKSLAHIAPLIGVGLHRNPASRQLSAKISASSSTINSSRPPQALVPQFFSPPRQPPPAPPRSFCRGCSAARRRARAPSIPTAFRDSSRRESRPATGHLPPDRPLSARADAPVEVR